MSGNIDLDTDDIYLALVTSSYTPSQDDDEDMADIDNEVANGNGYTTGGKQLTVTVSKDNTNNRGKMTATTLTWTSSTITARGAVVYKSTGVAANDLLVCYIDFGADKTSTSGDFIYAPHADGIMYLG